MGEMSIKWKLCIALIATGLSLVIAYVWVAKGVFERDKISYVFDSQSSRVVSQKHEIEQRFERALLTARSVIATFDPNRGQLNSAGEQIFQEEKSLMALELWDEQTNEASFRIEKTAGVLPAQVVGETDLSPGKIQITYLSPDRFLMLLRYNQSGRMLRVRSVAELKNLLPAGETRQTLMLLQKGNFIADSNGGLKLDSALDGLIPEIEKDHTDKTMIWGQNSRRFLISTANVGVGDFKVVAATPEEVALGALGTLFNRSLVFLAASTFALIAVSLTLARGLTINLGILTQAALKIGQGDFGANTEVKSKDEMGVLSKAISKMAKEIQRLLLETRDKARMEAELKTASLVQESLLPSVRSFKLNEMEINGIALTSTECGGDWWYYYAKGDDLYVAIADATGHGTPAALITAAARSVFSRLQEEDLSLPAMMHSWDRAVHSCSSGRVFMTGILMKINTTTGVCHYISAGHESPYWLKQGDGDFQFESLDMDKNKALGEGYSSKVTEQTFQMNPNDSLVLFTDGLFSVVHADGKVLSERRFGKNLAVRAATARSAEHMLKSTLLVFEEHRQDLPLPDDVTIVALRRRGPVPESEILI